MDMLTQFPAPEIAFFLTLVFGFWLSNVGKPYNGLLFNIHKLLALGAVILLGMQLAKTPKSADPLTLIIALLVVAALCIVALFASGALLSAGKLDYVLMLSIHRIAPAVLTVVLALLVYLLVGDNQLLKAKAL
jgi:hypothetical protein